ncbi:type III needle complex assembly protein [Iodobacter fluviatilis]|uniref:Surface presentation of antigen gene type M protein n=1 Tax=Iodobacter fluviatilis TaxID=537 RepID=A0A377Q8P1_9NEIS|nr:type III needle complex assembly protein [Iodobacter fluviatilis]TCU86890.1 surface presentation of antigen gene type M protein [Iodobacter fluviatilis]STQ90221.1 type III secretion system protein SpaM [Iodobacter fluviatilis]
MRLLHKLTGLLRRCVVSQQRCDTRLAQLIQQWQVLSAELDGLDAQRSAIKQLLHSKRPQGCVMNRGELFAMQRRLAVLRRQLHLLDFQEGRVREQQQLLQTEKEAVLLQRQYWLRKQDKYERWGKIQQQAWRLYQLRQEDSEAQERVTWGK